MFKNSNINGDRLANSPPPSASIISIMPSREDRNHGQPQLSNGVVSTPRNIDVNPYTESPYKDPELISIDVGPKPVRYYIHRTILSQSKVLFAKTNPSFWQSKANIITLPDLDESTAHTLVHYLYSGDYQMLKRPSSIRRGKEVAYQSSVLVYCTALRYELSGLADLAREKIRCLGEQVPILDILFTSRVHAFPNLPQDDSWFSTYLHNTIEMAAKTNPKLFTESSFSDQLEGNRTFRHVVVKAIVACQTSRATELEDHGKTVSTLTMGAGDEDDVEMHNDTTLHDTYEDPPASSESESSQPAPSQLVQEAEAFSDEGLEPAMKPELTMELEENPAEDGDGSAFSFGNKAKKSKKKGSTALIEDSVPESGLIIKPEKVKEDDLWTFSFGAGTAKDKKKKKKEEGGAIIEEAPPEPELQPPQPDLEPAKEEDAWEWGTTASSKEKKMKKKKGRVVIEEVKGEPVIEEPPPLELAPPPLAEDGWGAFTAVGSKKKKGKKGAREESRVEEPPLPPPEPEVLPEPEPKPEHGPEPVKEELLVGPFKGLSKSQKKSLEAKMKKEEEEATAAAAATAELRKQDDGWGDYWGTATTTKKKKGKKGKEEPTYRPPPSKPEPMFEKDVAAPKAEPMIVPETEPVVEEKKDDGWGNWALTTTSSKKKKGKKGAVGEPMPPPSPPPAIPEPETEPEKDKIEGSDWAFSSIWGGGSKKKKKGKDTKHDPLFDSELEPVVENAPIEEHDGVEESEAED